MIELKGLSKTYGDRLVLDALNLKVGAGERVALLGLNGSGKTTLLRSILGLTDFSGNITVDGYDVEEDGPHARERIGYVPQKSPLFDMTVGEMIKLFASMRGVPLNGVQERLNQLGLDLDDHVGKRVSELSGGMMQKTLVGLALAQHSEILLLDEPTANLDPRARRDLLRMIANVPEEVTILMASHRLTDVEAVAERLIVLHGGRVCFDGSLDQLRERTGLGKTLWLTVADRERAVTALEAQYGESVVRRNGASVGVSIVGRTPVDVVAELGTEGLTVDDLWTELPSLTEMLEALLQDDPLPAEGAVQ